MDAATVKGVIDRLKARGLVELGKHEVDKRRLLVSLTAEGRATIERLIPLAEQITAETLAPLSPTEVGDASEAAGEDRRTPFPRLRGKGPEGPMRGGAALAGKGIFL